MVWCCFVLKLSTLVILGMEWVMQMNPRINWSEKTIEQASNNMNVFLEACGLGRTRESVNYLNLIGAQQLSNMVCTTKGKNLCAWVVQCIVNHKLNSTELEKSRSLNGIYLYSEIGIQRVLHGWLLENALHLKLDMFCS